MNQPYQPGSNTMQENVHDPRYAFDMEEDRIDLLHYWRVVRKYLFQIIGLAIADGLLAVLVANSMTPIYTAISRVSIERVSPATGGTSGDSWYTMQKYPGTQHEILKSQTVAEQVVEDLKLWEHAFFIKEHIDSSSLRE